jgi:hypothetical protein
MVEPLRHRQMKGAATDMFYLMPPRHISTLPWLRENSEIEFANANFVSTSIDLKNKSDGCRDKTIEKTILRAFRARTFSRSQGHLRKSNNCLPSSATTSTADHAAYASDVRKVPKGAREWRVRYGMTLSRAFSTSMASSFETHRFAMLLRIRSQTHMVRSASSRVSNHEATGEAAIQANRKTL